MSAVKWFIESVKNPTRAERLGRIAQLAHIIRTGKLYDCHPSVIEKLADDLDLIANGEDANSVLVGGKKGREKSIALEKERMLIASFVRYFKLRGHPLRESKHKLGAYELAKQQLETLGFFQSVPTIHSAYGEHKAWLEKTEAAFRDGTIRDMQEPWWISGLS